MTADGVAFRMDGLEDTVRNLEDIASKPTRRNVIRRALIVAADPTANMASSLAPVARGILAFSIVTATALTRRHRGEKISEVEVYVGPTGGQGATFYATHQEFGTVLHPAHPYMRPAWEATKGQALGLVVSGLRAEIEVAAQRAARKVARLARAT